MPTLSLMIDARKAKEGAKEFADATKGAGQAAGDATAKARELEKALDGTAAKAKKVAAEARDTTAAVKATTAEMQRSAAAQDALNRVRGTGTTGPRYGVIPGIPPGLSGLLGPGAAGLSSVVSQAQQGSAALEGMAVSAGASATSIGLISAAGAGLAVVAGGFYAAASAAAKLEQSLIPVVLLGNGTAELLADVKSRVTDLSRQSGLAAGTIAEGISRAYVTGSRSIEDATLLTEAAIKGSLVGLGEVPAAVARIDQVLKTYRLAATEANDTTALIFSGARSAGMAADQFADALGRAGLRATDAGLTVRQTALDLVLMAKGGATAEQSVQSFNTILGKLQDVNDPTRKQIVGLGFDLSATAIRARALTGTIRELNAIPGGAQLARDLANGERGAQGLLATLSTNSADAIEAVEHLSESTIELGDALERRANLPSERLGRTWNKLKEIGSELSDVALQVSAALVGTDAPPPAARNPQLESLRVQIRQALREGSFDGASALGDALDVAIKGAQTSIDELGQAAFRAALETGSGFQAGVAQATNDAFQSKALLANADTVATINEQITAMRRLEPVQLFDTNVGELFNLIAVVRDAAGNLQPILQEVARIPEQATDPTAAKRALDTQRSAEDLASQFRQQAAFGLEREALAIEDAYQKSLLKIKALQDEGEEVENLLNLREEAAHAERSRLAERGKAADLSKEIAESSRLLEIEKEREATAKREAEQQRIAADQRRTFLADLQAEAQGGLGGQLASIQTDFQRRREDAVSIFGEGSAGAKETIALLGIVQKRVEDLAIARDAEAKAAAHLLEIQKQQLTAEERLKSMFTVRDFGELLIKPQLNLDLGLVDAQLAEQSRQISEHLKLIFANPNLSADEIVREVERARDALAHLEEVAQLKHLPEGIGAAFGSEVEEMVFNLKSGEDAFRSFALNASQQLFNVLVTQKLVAAASNFLSGLNFGGGASKTTVSFGESGGTWAKGGVFDHGNVVPFAGGGLFGGLGSLITRPVYFPMSGGKTGLAGEAGEEAILPLRRGPDGRLGVQASGSDRPTIVHEHRSTNITMHVRTPDTDGFRKSRRQIAQDIQRLAT